MSSQPQEHWEDSAVSAASECMARRVSRAQLRKKVLQGLPGFFSSTNYESIKLSSCCMVSPGAVTGLVRAAFTSLPPWPPTAEAGACSEQRIQSEGCLPCSHSPSPSIVL